MKKSTNTATKKKVKKISKKATTLKKKATKGLTGYMAKASKKLNAMKKTSAKALKKAKKSMYNTEEQIVAYVKENPIKTASAVALTALIAGYVSRYHKK